MLYSSTLYLGYRNIMLWFRGVGLDGGEMGLSLQGPHVRTAHKYTRMSSCGCREGPVENACVKSAECCAMPLPWFSRNRVTGHLNL